MPPFPFSAARRRQVNTLAFGGALLLWSCVHPAPAPLRAADARPVSVQDLCLMLRSGYTSAEVLQETAARPLLEPLNADSEKALRAAGGDQRLIDALRTSHPALSPAEAVAAHQRQAEQEQRAAAAAIQQAAAFQPSRPTAPTAPTAPAADTPGDPHALESLLHDKLVVFRDEKFEPAGITALQNKTLIGLYYSRFMSKAGASFSSDLAKFYRSVTIKHPEFEIVLISGDNTAFAMENMMRREKMPWLTLAFDQISQVPMVSRFIDNTGASRLIVVDNFGRIHADYRVSVNNNILPLILPDLTKVIEDPTKPSTLAPPAGHQPPPAAPAAHAP